MSTAALRPADVTHHLIDVLTATGPRGLTAFAAGDDTTHGGYLSEHTHVPACCDSFMGSGAQDALMV